MISFSSPLFKTNNPPAVWFMRQAGRYLPEYMEVRNTTKDFIDFCYSPEKAAKVTLQPIERFDIDAAIIFSDILVVIDALNIGLSFKENIGPVIEKVDLTTVTKRNFNSGRLNPVYEAIKLTRGRLSNKKSLIGFCGAPWTLSCYLIEGGSSKDFASVREFSYKNPQLFSEIIYFLSDIVVEHALEQIKAGADCFQLFDSWAGVVANQEYEKWIIEPAAYIVKKIKAIYPDINIIGFPRASGIMYLDYIKKTGIDAVGVDYNMPLNFIRENTDITIQGNLDPMLLKNDIDKTLIEAEKNLRLMQGKKFIFNLGHGILPKTPVDNVAKLVEFVKSWK